MTHSVTWIETLFPSFQAHYYTNIIKRYSGTKGDGASAFKTCKNVTYHGKLSSDSSQVKIFLIPSLNHFKYASNHVLNFSHTSLYFFCANEWALVYIQLYTHIDTFHWSLSFNSSRWKELPGRLLKTKIGKWTYHRRKAHWNKRYILILLK